MTAAQIAAALKQCPPEQLPKQMAQWAKDERATVRRAVEEAQKRYWAYERELERLSGLLRYERAAQQAGYGLVAGTDEAGRGPLAGPVVAAAVILPEKENYLGLNDSKKVTEKNRERLYEQITATAISWAVGIVSPQRIDTINILRATYEAMEEAVGKLTPGPEYLLVDALTLPHCPLPQEGIIHGDAKSLSIAAASIIAKVTRDRLMKTYDEIYPGYGFARHKGYGSPEHLRALEEQGPCPIHRRTFLKHILGPGTAPTRQQIAGRAGEDSAAAALAEAGYEILTRNYHTREGEIDLVAKDKNTIVFVEVKCRRTGAYGCGAEAVDSRKQEKIRRAARAYLLEEGLWEQEIRFDVVEVGPGGIRIIKNAFWEQSQ